MVKGANLDGASHARGVQVLHHVGNPVLHIGAGVDLESVDFRVSKPS
jgi:hypothetical protein